MLQEKLFRDPIHDLITFDLEKSEDRLMLELIDTFEVQRLRRIKQVGMAHMAYPGAEHSRFAHSLGVLHLVRRMLDRLCKGRDIDHLSRVATMAAALLHDVGHGPYSHVMEKFFQEHHEQWSCNIILSEKTEVGQVLRGYSLDLPELTVAHLSRETNPRWLSSLISSQLDADRFDYLARDSHMTGVKYGVFDLERLILLMRVTDDGERVVMNPKGLLPVEKYLQSRYQMYRQVYYHKTVTAAEAMLMALMERARDLARDGDLDFPSKDTPLYRVLVGGELDILDYIALDDGVLMNAMSNWSQGGDAVLKDLSLGLMKRRIFKSFEIESEEETDMLFEPKLNAARELLEAHGRDFRYYLKFSKSSDTPYKPYSPRGKENTIWIQDAHDPSILKDVSEMSPTVKAFTESPYTIHQVFFPEFGADGVSIRKELEEVLRS